ncbi:MAG: hypothetical protein LUG19_01885 [Desulfovibrio sp.]|uniref:DHH family phosphoesterase n=1 Tax=Desulfovibrio sp. TaxID=885 RepID=UPI002586046D|nr:hypothetical protein [Desulfovibrio sp.]MCD7982990.1 hypothetical protein [Desulfovibrio sp.]
MRQLISSDTNTLDLSSLRSRRDGAICCPAVPDADTGATGYALSLFFASSGKTPLLFYPGNADPSEPGLLEMLSCLDIPLRRMPQISQWDGLCVFVGSRSTGDLPDIRSEKTVIVGNHIPLVPPRGDHDIRPHLTACSTLAWDLLRQAGYPIDRTLAAGLLYGLYSASNGFSEIRFPLDRDMLDFMPYDNALFNRLKRSNLRMEDLHLAAEALHGLERHAEDGVLLANVLPCEPGILRFLSDLALRVHGIDLALTFFETAQGVRFALSSGTREIKASDLAARLFSGGSGHGGGGLEKGGGFINAEASELGGAEGPLGYFRRVICDYRGAYDILDCLAEKAPATGTLRAYQKLPVVQGFVRCSRVFPRRSLLQVRMLEGDITIEVTPQTYLMIGITGEVYPISRQTFAKTYVLSEASPLLDAPYAPAVLDSNGGRIELMTHAESCVSREGRVLARQLQRGVKIFTSWDRERYVLGEPGDWLVRRKDDARDIYIVKEHIFPRLYKAVTRPDA